MKFAIYSRKSKFTGKGESIENQIELCKNYIYREFPDVKEEILVYEDEGFSGKNIDRPQFKEMMKEEQKAPFDFIVCYKLDRISRNVGDFSTLIQELSDKKTAFVSLKEKFDTSTPMGRAMMYIASVFSQLERETIAERIRDNMHLLAKTGRWLGGNTPLGFHSSQKEKFNIDGKTKTFFQLSPIKEELDVVKLIYDKYYEFQSFTKLETFLINADIKTKRDARFQVNTLRSILTNPVYCVIDAASYSYFQENQCNMCFELEQSSDNKGFMVYNKTFQNGKVHNENPFCEWIVASGEHEGIIQGEKWVKAQKIILSNAHKSFNTKDSKVKNEISLFSGLVMCAKCGSFMRPRVNSNKNKNEHGEQTFAYMCELKKKSKSQKCQCPNINGNILDKILCDEILNYRNSESDIYSRLRKLKRGVGTDCNESTMLIDTLKNSISEKQDLIRKLIINLAKSDESLPIYEYTKDEITLIDSEIKSLRMQLVEHENKQLELVDYEKQFEIIKTSLDSFSNLFHQLTVHEKRMYLRTIIEKVSFDGEKANIFIFGE